MMSVSHEEVIRMLRKAQHPNIDWDWRGIVYAIAASHPSIIAQQLCPELYPVTRDD